MEAVSVSVIGSFKHDTVYLFENLEFNLEAGCWTCLLGPSGAGKTTLLRLIAGLPAGGEFYGEINYQGKPQNENLIAYMAQSALLPPWLNVTENVLLGTRLRGGRPDHKKARQIIEQVGLNEHHQKRPGELSGGMRQRVALARTLLEERPIVLLDEPFSALDSGKRAQMQELAYDVFNGKTVLLVTHDPAEAARLGQKIYMLTANGLTEQPVPASAPIRAIDHPDVLNTQAALLRTLRNIAQ